MTRTTVLAQAKTQRNVAKIFWLEAKYEFLKTLRIPRYTVATLDFTELRSPLRAPVWSSGCKRN